MALAFRITNPADIPRLFASHDEYCSILNELFERTLTPHDDYYTAPWAFMPTGGDDDDDDDDGGYIIFTCRVPWTHGCGHWRIGKDDRQDVNLRIPSQRNGGNWREQHFLHAKKIMKESCCNGSMFAAEEEEEDSGKSFVVVFVLCTR